ncbi:MAG: hypothetical protein ABL888_21955, partial [Pirellulaceae bacterium]
ALNDAFHPCKSVKSVADSKENIGHGPTRNFTDVARISEAWEPESRLGESSDIRTTMVYLRARIG